MATTMIPQHELTTPSKTVLEKANNLFKLGYRAERCQDFLIIETPLGKQYKVDPRNGTCNCAATTTCAHILGWRWLCTDMADLWAYLGMQHDMDALMCRLPGGCYSETGLEMRGKAVACCDRARALRFWAEDVVAAAGAETRRAA